MADKEVKVSRRREKARGLLSKFNFNKSDILLLSYLGQIEEDYQCLKSLGWEDKNQELLSEAGIAYVSRELNLKYPQVRQSYRKLQNKWLVERVVHNYYTGRIFLGLTENGKKLYEFFKSF